MSLYVKYELHAVIGRGTYGKVFKGIDRETREVVAIKDIEFDFTRVDKEAYVDDGSPLNEVIALNILSEGNGHPNVLKLIEFYQTESDVYLVFEYLLSDLKKYLDQVERRGEIVSPHFAKSYTRQFLSGLQFCHDLGIIHRDLKSANILLDKEGHLKIADFGMAWNTRVSPACNRNAYTLWYRPPEIFLGIKCYGFSADIWAAGCVIYEIATTRPLFIGDTEIDMLFKQFREFNTPTEETWPGVTELPYYNKLFPIVEGVVPLSNMTSNLELRDLLLFMLKMDPNERPTAEECLLFFI